MQGKNSPVLYLLVVQGVEMNNTDSFKYVSLSSSSSALCISPVVASCSSISTILHDVVCFPTLFINRSSLDAYPIICSVYLHPFILSCFLRSSWTG